MNLLEYIKNKWQRFLHPVQVGDVWEVSFKSDDPWTPARIHICKVLDVKDGWVKYKITGCLTETKQTVDVFLWQSDKYTLKLIKENK